LNADPRSAAVALSHGAATRSDSLYQRLRGTPRNLVVSPASIISTWRPKFEVNPTASLQLGADLKALGMPLAFDHQRADFTGIASPPDPTDRLVISDVFHKGFVRVDEKGTEAAAATAVVMSRAGGMGAPPRRVRADRPFLFLIRDNASGLIVFMGRVSDPSST
jgi:serpin B